MIKSKRNISDLIRFLPLNVVNHMYRVGLLTSILTEKISGSDSALHEYQDNGLSYYGKAAFFHDIGKVFIPFNLLIKPNRFTAEEMSMMKNHTLCAQVLFDDINRGLLSGMPEPYAGFARDAAIYHHEWWNGKGYPYGISQKEIPLIARIVSVCDAYDAITSERNYKAAYSHGYACRELERFSGTQFDPALIKVFLGNEAEFSDLIRINSGYSRPLIDK